MWIDFWRIIFRKKFKDDSVSRQRKVWLQFSRIVKSSIQCMTTNVFFQGYNATLEAEL